MKHIRDIEKKERLEFRQSVGVQVTAGSAKFPNAYQLYYVVYEDGTSEVVRGDTLHILPGFRNLNGTKAERKEADRSYHPELHDHIQAVAILLGSIGRACWDLDFPTKRALPQNRTGTSALRKRRSEPLNQKGKKKNARRSRT